MDKINTYYSKLVALTALDLAVAKDECTKLMHKQDRTSQEQALLDHWVALRETAQEAFLEATNNWVLALREVPSRSAELNEFMAMAKAVT